MKINKVQWRNFGPYGNKTQILDLNDKNSLIEISGKNGNGKSTISEVMTFCLYGKVESKNLSDLPNRINGCAWVKIEVEARGKNVIIERGIDPSLFNVWIDGVLDKRRNKDLQEHLTESVYGIPYYIFNNTISLSINDFKSFLKMNPTDKRMIIDKIFGFEIINQMREIIKGEAKKIKDDKELLIREIHSLNKSLERTQSEIDLLLIKIDDNKKEELLTLNERLIKIESLTIIQKSKKEEYEIKYDKLSNLMLQTELKRNEIDINLKTIKSKINLYKEDKCPTCSTSFLSDEFVKIQEILESEKIEAIEFLDNINKEIQEYRDNKEILKKDGAIINEKGEKIRMEINRIKNRITEISGKDYNNEIESLNRILKSFNLNLEETEKKNKREETKAEFIKKMDEILGDKGVKQLALYNILPSLNSNIQNYINKLGMNFSMTFNTEFIPTIKQRGAEISVKTLSTGESKKMDFIVLISMLKILKLKFSTLNLLFLDELFSSIDPEGIEDIIDILKDFSKNQNLNVFVINHAPLPTAVFDGKINIIKNGDFSSLSVDL